MLHSQKYCDVLSHSNHLSKYNSPKCNCNEII